MAVIHQWAKPMTATDKAFYEAMGKRIAEFRKAQGLTQVQLAEIIGVSQQTLAHYEVGRLRIGVESLTRLADTLAVSLEELVSEPKKASKNKRGPVPKLQQQIEQLSDLPRAKQKFISEMLEALIQQQQAS